jgi:hypothetical protein
MAGEQEGFKQLGDFHGSISDSSDPEEISENVMTI